ncbi:L-asparaginase 1 isoform X1 [Vespa velutina]|uniref:L-asparaginase 1 isoform X1 n=2 Tax=Vespa velutina TaxID=202808 RepID=UPI001FB33FE6|nr:L-asparaginase 1 isoform X1 [Vespa velutina]
MLRSIKNENDQKLFIDNDDDQATEINSNDSEKYSTKENATTSEIKSESRVLVLYTGGTIGMIRNESGVLVPKANSFVNNLRQFSQMHDRDYAKQIYGKMADESPLILPVKTTDNCRVIYEVLEYSPLCDSSDMTMDDWILIANDIKKYYNDFDGFVILHGTDTLSYTASALSFMLQDLDKIVILTGSQVPIFDTRNDGVDNFLTSLVIAANYNIPEVCVFFGTNLMRGNRTSKVSATSFDAFHSPNFPPLATVGINIEVDYRLTKYPQGPGNFTVHLKLNRNVGLLRLFPGITADLVKAFLQSPTEGVVLQTYGSGNIPSNREDIFVEFREATRRGIIIINITQCTTGRVSGTYEAGKLLEETGVISGYDMTPEAALTKLAYVLSNTDWNVKRKRRIMQSNLRGELTSSQLPFMFESDLVNAVARSLKLSSRAEFQELTSILIPSMLNAAVVKCDIDKLKSLKEYGANVSQTNVDGRTALHIACCQGNLNIVQELLKMGANVNKKDRFQRTPLIEAIENDHCEIINILLEHGSKLDKDVIGNKICDVVGSGNAKRLQSYLIADPDISERKDTSGRTPLHLAALHNDITIITLLLNHGANPKSIDMIGHTPFDLAKLVGAVDAMECLTINDDINE